jgi:hypothetical protein
VATFERIIITAFNQKLALGALSTDILILTVEHINEVALQKQFSQFHPPAG